MTLSSFYAVFNAVMYVYLGPTVASPAFSSLPLKWAKATYGIALANFLIAGSLYSHTAAKLFFIRMFRRTRHLHQHTFLGWGTWTVLIVLANGAAFVLAVGVPIVSPRLLSSPSLLNVRRLPVPILTSFCDLPDLVLRRPLLHKSSFGNSKTSPLIQRRLRIL
jgi:hypothetical protein